MRIFLIGLSGSGKSTLAKKLAAKMKLTAIDLDGEIEKFTQKSIFDLISKEGENQFRVVETQMLTQILEQDNFVLACGGGTPCYNNNLQLMKNKGLMVYLKLPVKALKSRLSQSYKRPLLNNNGGGIPMEEQLEIQLNQRSYIYEQADIIWTGLTPSSEKLNDLITQIKLTYTK